MVAVLPGAGGVLRGVVMAAAVSAGRGGVMAAAAPAVQGGKFAGLNQGAAGGQMKHGRTHTKTSFASAKKPPHPRAQRLGET